ncbi:unnamed protein product [Polarella glacialis]|uniref:Uncharacterized protein n=1 Tax=Polarella glacialis TaxID=89957 RepID=A0A813FQM8_POLGL|nr:unnamed protein product [Polarella glacialis]
MSAASKSGAPPGGGGRGAASAAASSGLKEQLPCLPVAIIPFLVLAVALPFVYVLIGDLQPPRDIVSIREPSTCSQTAINQGLAGVFAPLTDAPHPLSASDAAPAAPAAPPPAGPGPTAGPGTGEAQWLDSVRLEMEGWLNISVVAMSPGKLDARCGGQARFAYFSGQFRTFARNVCNRDSFLSGSGEGCWVQVLYTYEEIDSPRFRDAYSAKDVVEAAAGYRSAVPGAFAFLVARRLARPRPDILPGVVRFASLVAERHGLRRSAADVIVVSRPDILFSRALDHPQLQAYALRPGSPPFILFPSHHGEKLIGNDPSEMLLLASRALLEDLCVASCATWHQIRGGCRSESGCYGRGCGYYGSKWIVAGGERGYDACFMRPLMRLVLARPENNPGAWLEVGGGKGPRPGPNTAMLPGPPMRLLEGLRCARD